jgi:hypothetical protein
MAIVALAGRALHNQLTPLRSAWLLGKNPLASHRLRRRFRETGRAAHCHGAQQRWNFKTGCHCTSYFSICELSDIFLLNFLHGGLPLYLVKAARWIPM